MEGQNFTASGERKFDGYKLYQAADANDQSGYVSRPYKVGTKFMDAERAGIKRIKEIVGEDGTVVVRVYLLDPKQQSKRSDGSLSTDGYMLFWIKKINTNDYSSIFADDFFNTFNSCTLSVHKFSTDFVWATYIA